VIADSAFCHQNSVVQPYNEFLAFPGNGFYWDYLHLQLSRELL